MDVTSGSWGHWGIGRGFSGFLRAQRTPGGLFLIVWWRRGSREPIQNMLPFVPQTRYVTNQVCLGALLQRCGEKPCKHACTHAAGHFSPLRTQALVYGIAHKGVMKPSGPTMLPFTVLQDKGSLLPACLFKGDFVLLRGAGWMDSEKHI